MRRRRRWSPVRRRRPPPPEVITRSDTGQATVRAVRLEGELDLDGRSTKPSTTTVPPMSGFIQVEPQGGPAGDGADGGLGFLDEDNVYVGGALRRLAARVGWSPTRCAATASTSSPEREHRLLLRHVLRPPQRLLSSTHADRRPHGRAGHQRAAVQRRLEPDLGRAHRAASRVDGPSKRASRSSRCATGRAARRSGAFRRGA